MPGRGLREGEPWRGEDEGPRGSETSKDQEGIGRRPGFTARRARHGFPGGRKPPESSLPAVAFTGAGAEVNDKGGTGLERGTAPRAEKDPEGRRIPGASPGLKCPEGAGGRKPARA